MKICILTIATNKYIHFVQDLYDNLEEFFLPDYEKNCLLFTDHEINESSDNVKIHQIEHEPWPMPTLKRYNYFIKEKDFILQHDYCFYFDVDMALQQVVRDEVLGDLVATNHFYQSCLDSSSQSFDRNPDSLAYVSSDQKTVSYYAGGFNGGKTKTFLEMSEVIANRVNEDLKKGVIALWHDESHMNRYMIDNPPTVALSPNYCYPEPELGRHSNDNPKIIALLKNHGDLRS
jgi:histo-blood group ABO system transferase